MPRFVSPLLVVALLVTAGCAVMSGRAYDHAAAATVEALLDLRRADVRDAAEYTPYLADPGLAAVLASPSVEPIGTPRVPAWEPLYVSEEGSGTASVVVIWKHDAAFPDWPEVNVFLAESIQGRWVVTDALEASSAPAPMGSGAR